jgi:cytochrome c
MRFGLCAPLVAALLLPWLGGYSHAALSGHGGPVKAIAVSADGTRALTASFDYTVILWNLTAQRQVRRLVGHDAAVGAVAFLPGDRGVSASDDGTLILWNLADGTVAARWRGHAAKVAALAISPNGNTVASGGWDNRVMLWDVATGKGRVLEGHEANVNAVAISPDGKLLASGDYDGKIILWRGPALQAVLPGNGFPVNALDFTPQGKLVAALGDKTVRVLDPLSKRELLRYEVHQEPVVSLALSRDGRLAASGSSLGAVEIWQIATGRTVRGLYVNPGPAWALAFTPDAARLLTAGSDGVVRIWNIATGAEATGGLPAISAAQRDSGESRGAALFRKCQACHDFLPTGSVKAGPTFWHLIGRKAGSVAGYPYSPALKESGLTWDEATIDRLFAEGPQAVAPGSKMPLQKMPSAKDRADLIHYLKQQAFKGGGVE